MSAAILEIKDGCAVGLIHRPKFASTGEDILEAETACGLLGYVYRHEGLKAMRFPVCGTCRATVPRPKRVPLDRSPRPCDECGEDFTPAPTAPGWMRFCSKRCRRKSYYYRNRDHLRTYHRDWMRARRAA